MKRWINGHRIRAAWTRAGVNAAISKKFPNSPIYVLEEDDLERVFPPESADERLQRVERTMLALTAEWLELTGRAEPPRVVEFDITNGDLDALRDLCAQVHRMANVDRETGPYRGTRPHLDGNLRAMVRALTAVIGNVDGANAGRQR